MDMSMEQVCYFGHDFRWSWINMEKVYDGSRCLEEEGRTVWVHILSPRDSQSCCKDYFFSVRKIGKTSHSWTGTHHPRETFTSIVYVQMNRVNSASLGRVRSDFEAFLTKWSSSISDGKKRERFLYNNYSLVSTVLSVFPLYIWFAYCRMLMERLQIERRSILTVWWKHLGHLHRVIWYHVTMTPKIAGWTRVLRQRQYCIDHEMQVICNRIPVLAFV